MKRRIHIYQENLNPELADIFSAMNDMIRVEELNHNVITLIDMDYFNEEPIDFEEMYYLLIQDFDATLTFFIEPYIEDHFELSEAFKEFITEWADLLNQPIPKIKRLSVDIEVEAEVGRIPDPQPRW